MAIFLAVNNNCACLWYCIWHWLL